MFCGLIVLGLAAGDLVAGLKYPPLLVGVAVLGALPAYIVRDLGRERRLG